MLKVKRVHIGLAVGVLATFGLSGFAAAPASASNPPYNIPPSPYYPSVCYGPSGVDNSQACISSAEAAIDHARAQEGIGVPIEGQLPGNFGALPVGAQLVDVINAERTVRGLPAATEVSSLDALAQTGASTQNDPQGPYNTNWASIWAGGQASVLAADYDWMYNDGFTQGTNASSNLDCSPSSPGGCWGHRNNILASLGSSPEMGVGYTAPASYAEVMVGSNTPVYSAPPATQPAAPAVEPPTTAAPHIPPTTAVTRTTPTTQAPAVVTPATPVVTSPVVTVIGDVISSQAVGPTTTRVSLLFDGGGGSAPGWVKSFVIS